MSSLQRITNRGPHDAITVPDSPDLIQGTDPEVPYLPFSGEPAPSVFPMEADCVPQPDSHASGGKSILIVEDELIFAEDLKETLQSLGYTVGGIASTGMSALNYVKTTHTDLILMDINLGPGMNGIEVAEKILSGVSIPIIYLTAYADPSSLEQVKITSPYGYILKPFAVWELQSAIEIAFYKHTHDLALKKAYGELEQRVAERTAELEQINRALAESEGRYRSLFEGVPIGLYRTTPTGEILDINPALVHLLGYPNRERLMEVSVPALYMNPGERSQWMALTEQEGIVRDFEAQFRKFDGTIIRVRDTGKAVRDDSGRVLYYNGNIEDITERRRAEEELRSYQTELETQTEVLRKTQSALEASRNRYLDLYEFAPLGYFTLTDKALVTDVNRAGAVLLGVDRNEIINHGLGHFIAPESLDDWDRYFVNVRNLGAKQVCTLMLMQKDGSRFPARLEAVRPCGGSRDAGILLALTDITDIRRAEEEIQFKNLILSTQQETSLDSILIVDEGGKILFFNRHFIELWDIPEDIIASRSEKLALEFIVGKLADPEAFAAQVHYLYDHKDEKNREELRLKDGRILDRYSAPMLGTDKKYIGRVWYFRDITKRKRVEEALQLKDFAIVSSINAIAIADLAGNLTYVNPAFLSISGYDDGEEVLGRPVLSFCMVPDEAQRVSDGLLEQGNWSGELTGQRKDGTPVQVQLSTNTVRDASGTPVATMLSFVDITEHKAAEEALRASEQRYRTVVEDQTEFICRFSPDGKLTFINEAYCNYFRVNREEIIGRRHLVHLPPGDALQMKDHLATLTPENPVALISHRIVMPSGEERWHRWSDRAIYDKDGNVTEYQSVGRDITPQKETETQLKNYKETLEQRVRDRTSELSETNLKLKNEIEDRKKIQKKLTLSSNEKDLLLREVHHRVKNNLQLIIGLIDMTKTRAHEPIVISTLTDIMAKVQTMGSIHTRLYESKRFDKINMRRQVHDLVEMISGFHDHDHLEITTNIDCAEIYLPVDQAIPCALALNEIISNIHKHAFCGRRSGLVEISSLKKSDNLRFIIRDNGVGLPSGFDIEKSNRLGLKLMRTLVEQQLHGNVQIASKAGTEVVIEFPINRRE
ncbi:MAG: PAS domain S-box protein [Methanoregula sp.]|nr:PAS domain S-box protein [Methanoregula sp.]